MTLPIERYWSLERTLDFLSDLLDPKKTPKVPREIRLRAGRCLRHYPHKYELEKLSQKAPEILGDPEEAF